MIMLILESALNSQYKYLLKWMCKWDKNFFKDYFPALLQNKTSIMKKLSLNTKRNMNKTYQRNSHLFSILSWSGEKLSLAKKCEFLW